ncbi:hypothetical protein FHG87_004511 [Trinorchestia longiramus]|nr:hypothetical protein FHG87_004511 [Trinorchestia longiramus]
MGASDTDVRLQTVFGAASQGVSLLHRLAQPDLGTDAAKAKVIVQSAAVQQDVALALKSLEKLQTSYKQARAFTHEAFKAAGDFFRHLSNAISPTVS